MIVLEKIENVHLTIVMRVCQQEQKSGLLPARLDEKAQK